MRGQKMKMVSVLLVMCTVGACQVKPSMTVQGSPNENVKIRTTITPKSILPNATITLGR